MILMLVKMKNDIDILGQLVTDGPGLIELSNPVKVIVDAQFGTVAVEAWLAMSAKKTIAIPISETLHVSEASEKGYNIYSAFVENTQDKPESAAPIDEFEELFKAMAESKSSNKH